MADDLMTDFAKCDACDWFGPIESTADAGLCPKCAEPTRLMNSSQLADEIAALKAKLAAAKAGAKSMGIALTAAMDNERRLEASRDEYLKIIQTDLNVQIAEAEDVLCEVMRPDDWEGIAAAIKTIAAERDAAEAKIAGAAICLICNGREPGFAHDGLTLIKCNACTNGIVWTPAPAAEEGE